NVLADISSGEAPRHRRVSLLPNTKRPRSGLYRTVALDRLIERSAPPRSSRGIGSLEDSARIERRRTISRSASRRIARYGGDVPRSRRRRNLRAQRRRTQTALERHRKSRRLEHRPPPPDRGNGSPPRSPW